MNKEEYNNTFKIEEPENTKELFEKIQKMKPEEAEKLNTNINIKYLTLMENDMSFWISMMDYTNHIKHLDILDKEKRVFITNNNEFVNFIKLLKKRINNLLVVNLKDALSMMTEIKKENEKK